MGNVGIRAWFRRWWQGLTRQGQPPRQLLRLLRRAEARHWLELGIADPQHTQTVLQQLRRTTGKTIHYTAVDQFELRPTGPLPLRQVYAELKVPGVEVHLVPGPWPAALQRLILNGVCVDAVVISHHVEDAAVTQILPLLSQLLSQEAVWRQVQDEEGNVQFVPLALEHAASRRQAA